MPTQRKKPTGTSVSTILTALTTLAGNTAIVSGGPVLTHGSRLLSVKGAIGVNKLTAGDGPLLVGIMNADLSAAELEEYLENAGPLTPSDVIAVETSSRGKHIRVLGVVDSGNPSIYLDNKSLSGLRIAEDAGGYDWFIYNLGAALTTGSALSVGAQIFLEWDQ